MLALLTLIVLALLSEARADLATQTATNSSTIAITSDDRFLWVVNRDNDSVTVINATENSKVAEIRVGKEPRCVAITPDDKKVFVTNMVSGRPIPYTDPG